MKIRNLSPVPRMKIELEEGEVLRIVGGTDESQKQIDWWRGPCVVEINTRFGEHLKTWTTEVKA